MEKKPLNKSELHTEDEKIEEKNKNVIKSQDHAEDEKSEKPKESKLTHNPRHATDESSPVADSPDDGE